MKAVRIIGLLVVALVGGYLAIRYGRSLKLSMRWPPKDPARATPGSAAGDVGPVVKFDPFLVTDSQDDSQHITTVTFEVELRDEQGRDAVKSHASQIRSEVLTVLADSRLSELADPADYDLLKSKVQKRIQAVLPNHQVRRVLITELLTQ